MLCRASKKLRNISSFSDCSPVKVVYLGTQECERSKGAGAGARDFELGMSCDGEGAVPIHAELRKQNARRRASKG